MRSVRLNVLVTRTRAGRSKAVRGAYGPAMDHCQRHFGMELHAYRRLAEAECLVLKIFARREQLRARR